MFFSEKSTNRINKWRHVNELNGMFSIVYEAESIHQKYFNSAHMYIYSIHGVIYRSTSQAIQKLPAQWEIISRSIFREHASTIRFAPCSPRRLQRQTMGKALSQFLRKTSTLEKLLLTEDHLGASAVLLGFKTQLVFNEFQDWNLCIF